MPYNEDYTEVTCIAQSVVSLLASREIAATPSNYSLFFRYMQGTEQDLIASIDTYMQSGIAFDTEILSELKAEFPDPEITKEVAKKQSGVSKVLSEMFLKISDFSGESNKLSESIKKNASHLTESSSVEDIAAVVTSILEDAEQFEEYNNTFQSEIDEITKELSNLKKEYAEMKSVSLTDELTQVANRRSLDEKLKESLELCNSAVLSTLSICMIDIDHFKKFNDNFGHLTGDKVLKYVAQRLKQMIRENDFVSRFGGEEFLLVLPNRELSEATELATEINNYFSSTNLTGSKQNLGKITVSIGVAQYTENESSKAFIERADKALYVAKESGRNQVRCSN